MAPAGRTYTLGFVAFVLLMMTAAPVFAQQTPNSSRYGPNDTLLVPYAIYQGDTIPARNLDVVWVTARISRAMARKLQEWTRLRNAVYVTYPYARKAGVIMNEMNATLAHMNSEGQRKSYIKSKEKDLRREFADPLTQLSVYQGTILMKLINRQTGNNCYNIIKEYKGGFTARFWQTVAFFFGSSLKQEYDPQGGDSQMESIVREVARMYPG
jgi:hypothetical protein